MADASFPPDDLKELNHLDRAKNVSYLAVKLLADIPDEYSEIKIRLAPAIRILSNHEQSLSSLPKQLIHGDLGSDNFLFLNDDVFAVIDFTPEYQHELYSLCQFVYWNYLWNSELIEVPVLDQYLELYYGTAVSKETKKLYYLLLIQASLFRVAGVLLDRIDNHLPMDQQNKRIQILQDTIDIVHLAE